MEIMILFGLILLNGLFAMSEIAIVTAKKSRLLALSAKGNSSAQAAIDLAQDPNQFLSTIQIGITSIGVMNGIFGESILAEPFAIWLQSLGMSIAYSSNVATVLVVVVVTFVTILAGELVPKRIGQINAEQIACLVAKPMLILAICTKPFVFLLSSSTKWVMRVLGLNQNQDNSVTEEDIHAILDEGSHSGVLEQQEHAMVKNVLRLEGRSIASLMVPRADFIYLDTSLPLTENHQRVIRSPHSRFPVCEQNSENLIGVVNAKELLSAAISEQPVELLQITQEAHVVPETLTAMELLSFFRSSHSQMVFVVDEYGDLKGLVTLQDLLEALTGEFIQADEDDAYIIRRDDGSLLLDGMLSIVDLKDCLNISELPEENHYQTLNGLLMLIMGKVPNTAEKVIIKEWQFEIIDMDGRRVDKVLATKVVNQALEKHS